MLDKYEVEGELGRGSFGVVVLGKEKLTSNSVAIKLVIMPLAERHSRRTHAAFAAMYVPIMQHSTSTEVKC